MEAAEAEIIKSYGKEFSRPRTFVNKSKGAQGAHEAIRPYRHVSSYCEYR
jgi:DNA topoisomerase-1